MSWEESNACTSLKRDFLKRWFAEEHRFFLTGGSALGLFYLDHRRSYDLDLFSSEEVEGKEVQNLVHRIASEIGARCEAVRSAPDFHRFRLTRGNEREVIDVVVDRSPQLDPDKAQFGEIRVDTLREIVANKLAALVGRAEIKDIVDLYFLDKAGCDILGAVPDAMAKDGGWDPAVVSMLLEGLAVSEAPPWLLRPITPNELKAFVEKLRLSIAALALPQGE